MKASLLTMWCAHVLWCEFVSEQQKHAGLLYHVVASEEGVDGVKVVVKELRHTVDDVKGDGLQDTHHLHVFAFGITKKKTAPVRTPKVTQPPLWRKFRGGTFICTWL